MHPFEFWKEELLKIPAPRILRTGAKHWEGSPVLNHEQHVPNGVWEGTDIEPGEGVDLVGDLQRIDQLVRHNFDGIYCSATLEHIERPWCAVIAMGKILRSGGLLFLESHQTFPLHGYPRDFFRFSTDALFTLCWDAGLEVVSRGYSYPCTIVPPDGVIWNHHAKAYLNSCVCARKK